MSIHIRNTIAEALGISPTRIEPEVLLSDGLLADAIDRQTIACHLDETYQIELSDEAVASWQAISDVIASVEALGAQLPEA